MFRVHRKQEIFCEVCRVNLKGEAEYKTHIELEHYEGLSPKAKKRKHNAEHETVVDNNKQLEENNINEIEMEEVYEESKLLEKQNDVKVLQKQEAWFEKEVKFQEIKRQMSEEKQR